MKKYILKKAFFFFLKYLELWTLELEVLWQERGPVNEKPAPGSQVDMGPCSCSQLLAFFAASVDALVSLLLGFHAGQWGAGVTGFGLL